MNSRHRVALCAIVAACALTGVRAQEPAGSSPKPQVPAAESIEPGVVTSTSAAPSAPAAAASGEAAAPAAAGRAAPANAAAQPAGTKRVMDRIELDTTQITGNRELPKVLYIVPWKKPAPGDLSGRPPGGVLDEALSPVDRDVFRREVRYHAMVQPHAAAPAK